MFLGSPEDKTIELVFFFFVFFRAHVSFSSPFHLLSAKREEIRSRSDHSRRHADFEKAAGGPPEPQEGAFGPIPGSEAHAAFTFCAVAALALLERLDLVPPFVSDRNLTEKENVC